MGACHSCILQPLCWVGKQRVLVVLPFIGCEPLFLFALRDFDETSVHISAGDGFFAHPIVSYLVDMTGHRTLPTAVIGVKTDFVNVDAHDVLGDPLVLSPVSRGFQRIGLDPRR